MKVLVTGASGFIGSAVAGALLRAGHEVLGLVRNTAKGRELLQGGGDFVQGSLEDPGSWIPRAADCAAVVHCAAESSARYHELDRRTVDAVLAALSGAGGLPRAFVYTSGVWVYGDTKGVRVDESSALNPPPLVAPRVETERRVLAAHGGGLRTVVLRPGCVYGGRGSLTAEWFASASTSGAARIVGDGNFRWAMVHLEDLAELYRLALESDLAEGCWNATDRSRFTVLECARAASAAAGAGGKVATTPLEEARKNLGPMAECLCFDQHVDSSRAAIRLGWRPRHAGFVDEADRCFRSWKAHLA